MPEISRFFGIVIAMHYDDHPPPRALALVTEWAALHQAELSMPWDERAAGERPRHVEPLQ